MNEVLDLAVQVSTLIGLPLTAIPAYYAAFKKSNVEKFFEGIVQSGKDLSEIGKTEEIRRYFFYVLEKVACEANLEKINKWKNSVIHLATDFKDYPCKDNLMSTLEALSVFDLTVLYQIYSMDFPEDNPFGVNEIDGSIIKFFEQKNIPEYLTEQSIKRLSSYNLLGEVYRSMATFGTSCYNLHHTKNKSGPVFLKFISDDAIDLDKND